MRVQLSQCHYYAREVNLSNHGTPAQGSRQRCEPRPQKKLFREGFPGNQETPCLCTSYCQVYTAIPNGHDTHCYQAHMTHSAAKWEIPTLRMIHTATES